MNINMKNTIFLSSLLIRSTIGCALLGSVAFADTISNVNQTSDYTYRTPGGTTSFSNITAPNIDINHVVDSKPFYVEATNLKATGTVKVFARTGDVTLSNVEGSFLQLSTQNGNITLSGDIKAEGNASTVTVANQGDIILDGANCENVSVGYNFSGGEILISGNTSLSNVFFEADAVNVADDANLTLDDVFFTNRNGIEQDLGASAALTLGDNVTLTLAEGSKLDVTELTVGTGLNLVITLSEEAFATLDNTTFDIFSVQEGEVDLTGATISFTDGEQKKTGTIKAEGGSITVTDSYVVPEPTTAVLSLLALCGLAARRRRI